MILNYINKIRANINIYSTKKTSNILEGSYNSIYKGKSMNFEDLREYVIGDNIKDIDWKASTRSGTLLVKQYVAEKKHNIMLVLDTGKKMLADTESVEMKKEVAIMSAGTIAYLAQKNGDFVGSVYQNQTSIYYHPFKSGFYNIEKILSQYEKEVPTGNEDLSVENALDYINKHIKRRMIIFVLTDLEGMNKVKEETIKRVSTMHDVLFIAIGDAYMTGNKTFDVEANEYLPSCILEDEKLHEMEKKLREEKEQKCIQKLQKYRIQVATINTQKEITNKIIELLERHKYANNH